MRARGSPSRSASSPLRRRQDGPCNRSVPCNQRSPRQCRGNRRSDRLRSRRRLPRARPSIRSASRASELRRKYDSLACATGLDERRSRHPAPMQARSASERNPRPIPQAIRIPLLAPRAWMRRGLDERRSRRARPAHPSHVSRASRNSSPMLRLLSAKSALLEPFSRSVNVIGTSANRPPAR